MNIREDLKAYLDGELPASRAAEVERAIQDSPELQREVAMFKKISQSFAAHQSVPVTGKEELLSKIAATPKPQPWFVQNRLAAATGAFVLIVMAFTWMSPMLSSGGSAESGGVTASASNMSDSAMEFAPQQSGEASAQLHEDAETRAQSEKSAVSSPQSDGVDKDIAQNSAAGQPETLRVDRDVIQSSTIEVGVKDVYETINEVELVARGLGGFLENKNFMRQQGTAPTAFAMVVVPASKYATALDRIRKFGDVISESSTADDITKSTVASLAEVDRLEKKAREIKKQMIGARGSKKAQLQYDLDYINGLLTSQKQTLQGMNSQVAASRIALSLRESKFTEKENENWTDQTWKNASENFMRASRFLGATLINLLIFSPIWLPILGIFWLKGRAKKS